MTGDYQVKRHTMLIIASLFSILLLTFHFTDDRRSGYVIMLLVALSALGMPIIHIALARTVVTNEFARARGDYFFVWTLLALGVNGAFSFILSVRGLWRREWAQPR
jgi:hypothetical protein